MFYLANFNVSFYYSNTFMFIVNLSSHMGVLFIQMWLFDF